MPKGYGLIAIFAWFCAAFLARRLLLFANIRQNRTITTVQEQVSPYSSWHLRATHQDMFIGLQRGGKQISGATFGQFEFSAEGIDRSWEIAHRQIGFPP